MDGATVLGETTTPKPVHQVGGRDKNVREDYKPGARVSRGYPVTMAARKMTAAWWRREQRS